MSPAEREVRAAADALVAAFAAERLDEYFAAFAPDATFVFHTTPERLGSVAAYRQRWARWVREDDFHVRGCRSTEVLVHELGDDAALVVHDVETRVSTRAGEETLRERETIAFRRAGDGRWLAVHEHLSPAP